MGLKRLLINRVSVNKSSNVFCNAAPELCLRMQLTSCSETPTTQTEPGSSLVPVGCAVSCNPFLTIWWRIRPSCHQKQEGMWTPLIEEGRLPNVIIAFDAVTGDVMVVRGWVPLSRPDQSISVKLSEWGFSRICWETPTRKSSITPGFRRHLFPLSSFWILVSRTVTHLGELTGKMALFTFYCTATGY